jgi:ATP-dependent protease HslVU (ClpYQ) peptidase subunit
MAQPSVTRFVDTFKTTEEDWTLLVIEDERLYEVGSDLSVVEVMARGDCSYTAIGAGGDVALGSLFADHIDKESVTTALAAAEAHCVNVRSPFLVLETERLDDFGPRK